MGKQSLLENHYAKPSRAFSNSKRRASKIPEIFDIVCLGGGPAGLTLLSALRSNPSTSHLKIALVESQDLSNIRNWHLPPDKFSNRVSSLTPGSVSFLQEIGAWDHVLHSRVQPYHHMQVWDGITGASIFFDWQNGSLTDQRKNSKSTIAYMTENLNLTSALLKRLDELGSVVIIDNTRVESISMGSVEDELDLSSWPVLTIPNGRQLAARLLIGADGAQSPVRVFSGISSKGWDYNRHGLVATLELEDTSMITGLATAYQRFLPTGPIALLPLPDNKATLVWSTLPQHAAFLKTLSHEDFVQTVNAAFRLAPTENGYLHTLDAGQSEEFLWREDHAVYDASKVPGRITRVQNGTRASFPLKMRHADTYIGTRVALVGDAAHTIHPLAGQGLNQGQGDVQSLARTLKYAVEHGQDIGDQLTLESYPVDRYAVNNTLLGVVDKLHKLYSVESGPLIPLRNFGLRAVDRLSPLKGFLMSQAAGRGA
ncbi:MAG: putative ubiquinone biosynthesis monooxygenase [Vezdaea aestivalis]|nr:MAG: putative ubiquinone biosynthesis monooxygenase [Vezdaea aestivalis]